MFSKIFEILFSNSHCIFSTAPQSLIDIFLSFLEISQIFFQTFSKSLDKVTVEICIKFNSGLIKKLSCNKFLKYLKFFYWHFYIVLHKTIYKNSSLFKICSKIQHILFKILSNLMKYTHNFIKIMFTFFKFAIFQILRKFSSKFIQNFNKLSWNWIKFY